MIHATTTQTAVSLGRLHLLVALDPQEVGRRIALARQRKGWTQLAFALAANVSPSSVSRWERGALPPVRELVRVAAVLEVDVAELVEEPPRDDRGHTIHERLDRVERLLGELLERYNNGRINHGR